MSYSLRYTSSVSPGILGEMGTLGSLALVSVLCDPVQAPTPLWAMCTSVEHLSSECRSSHQKQPEEPLSLQFYQGGRRGRSRPLEPLRTLALQVLWWLGPRTTARSKPVRPQFARWSGSPLKGHMAGLASGTDGPRAPPTLPLQPLLSPASSRT